MTPILIKTIQFFLSLSLLIVLHELGHFIPAKLFKTRVEKFYLFFDVKFSFVQKENRRNCLRNRLVALGRICKDIRYDR